MPSVMIFIQFLQDPNGPHVKLLREAGLEVRFPPRPDITDEEENIRVLQGVSATIAGGEPYSRRVMAALPDLRVISRWGVGVDRVDLEAVTDSNAVVTITPSANHEAVAEHAVALLLAVSRFLAQRNDEIHRGLWERRCSLPLREKALGLVGLGRIGRSVAVRAEAFRMRLLAHEAYPDREFAQRHGIELVDLDTLLARSDYVTLHVPLTEETRGLINRRTLSRMKPGALLVNTSRGGLVVEEDLVDALKSGHLGGAGLDVFVQEPIQGDHPLLELDNVLVSDHTAGIDTRSVEAMAVEAARNIVELYRGGWPAGAVANPAVRDTWKW
ncbi:MAG: phosphoglycerate dehydrogenase [Acidobacteriota bacterium]|nr:phosphoglycerate dehydrogenase [Acidobacteriota bacterium]